MLLLKMHLGFLHAQFKFKVCFSYTVVSKFEVFSTKFASMHCNGMSLNLKSTSRKYFSIME